MEVLVHPSTLQLYRAGKLSLDDTLAIEQIWRHPFRNCEQASLREVEEALGEHFDDKRAAIERILRLGDSEPVQEERERRHKAEQPPNRHERIVGE